MKIADVRQRIANYGFVRAMYSLLYDSLQSRVGLVIYRAMTLELKDVDPAFLGEDPTYVFRFLTKDECLKHAAQPGNDLDPSFVSAAFAKGDKPFAILAGEQLANYGWYSNNPTPTTDELCLHFDPQYVYMYKGFTPKAFRGKRLHGVNMAKALKALMEEGSLAIVSLVEDNNFDSLRSVYRLGYKDFGRVYCVKLFGRYFIRNSSGCRRYGFFISADHPTGRVSAA